MTPETLRTLMNRIVGAAVRGDVDAVKDYVNEGDAAADAWEAERAADAEEHLRLGVELTTERKRYYDMGYRDGMAEVEGARQRAETFVRDVAEHGFRADCNPTMELRGDEMEVVMFFYRYLRGINDRLMRTALAALAPDETKEEVPDQDVDCIRES